MKRSPLLALRYADLMRFAVARQLIARSTSMFPRKKRLVLAIERAGFSVADL